MQAVSQSAAAHVPKESIPQLVLAAVRAADKLRGTSGEEKKAAVMEALGHLTDFPVSETVETLLQFRRRGCPWFKC